jgi:ABC-2 type transport system permease protein
MITLLQALAGKDLKLLARDRMGFFFVIAFPLMIALFFGSIFSGDSGGSAGTMAVAVQDEDASPGSAGYVQALGTVTVLKVESMPRDKAERALKKGSLTAIITLKKGFGDAGLFFGSDPKVDVLMDPSRKAEKEFLRGILIQKGFEQLQQRFMNPAQMAPLVDRSLAGIEKSTGLDPKQKDLLKDYLGRTKSFLSQVDPKTTGKGGFMGDPGITFRTLAARENQPRSYYDISFPQAVMWGLIACAAAFGLSLVQERIRGTYLRLKLAPLSRAAILGGKTLACFCACLADVALILGVGILFFHVRPGGFFTLGMAAIASALCFSGVMMFISVLGRTEQAVGGASWAVLLIMSMAGGGMIPLIIMPGWLLTISHFSPVKWGILAFEGAVWRGFSPLEMLMPCGILLGFGAAFYGIGLLVFMRRE